MSVHKNIKIIKDESKINNLENSNIKNILEELLNISSKINETQVNILLKIDNFENRITNIEKSISLSNFIITKLCENKYTSIIDEKYSIIELKQESLNIDKESVIRALYYKDYRSIINILRLYYKPTETTIYPIRITGKRSYEYFINNKWIPDLYGHYIMNTICINMQNLFIKYNIIDENSNIDHDEFMLVQTFIYKLSDEKYKKDIFKHIVEEIRINNII
jgi:hypothetical protein